jgi:hypothetical protein
MGPADGSDNYQIVTGGVKALQLTVTTGTATFISSVAATQLNISNVGGKFTGEGGATNYLGIYKDDGTYMFRVISNGSGVATFLSDDGSGNRTTVNDVLTITQTNANSPYSGFGSGILFRGTTYNGGGSGSPGVRNWGRIVMQLTDSSIATTGENMVFQVASADNSDTLTTVLTLAYNGASTFSNVLNAQRFISSTNIFGFFQNNPNTFSWEIGSDASVGTGMYIYNPTGGYALTLSAAGVLSTLGGGTSDRRTKEDIKYINESALPFINELNPVSFKFINDISKKTRRGFIAQEILETSIPDLVLGDGDQEGGTYGLDYDGILALAVKAIQEQQSQIDSLKAEIQTLKQ